MNNECINKEKISFNKINDTYPDMKEYVESYLE